MAFHRRNRRPEPRTDTDFRALDRRIADQRRRYEAEERRADQRFRAWVADELAKLSPEERAANDAAWGTKRALEEKARAGYEAAEKRRRDDRYMTSGT
jgi:hypothetical protein